MEWAAAPVAVAAAALVLLGAGVARGRSDPVTVLAAASLTDALPRLAPGNHYSFGGSDGLAAQIEQGVPADVYMSADTALPERLHREGLVDRPIPFAKNALVVVVPRSNPAGVHRVSDLGRRGVQIAVADDSVPVGDYTQQVLRRLHLSRGVNANVVSRETSVRSVLAKVALGQADAGFVYSTDARSARGKVRVIRIPARAQPNVTYALAVVSGSRHRAAANAFVRRVLGKSGQAVLARYGFLPVRHGM